MRRLLIVLALVLTAGAIALFSVATPVLLTRFDPAPHLRLGEKYDVRIVRDTWGIPHIYGKRDRDTAFGLAYAHAEDDFQTIQESIMTMRGRLSSVSGQLPRLINMGTGSVGLGKWFTVKGQDPLVVDYLAQLLRARQKIEERYESDLPADLRAVLEGYADGINFYAARNPEKTAWGFEPVHGKDIAAAFHFFTPFFYGLPRDIAQLYEPKRAKEVSALSTGGSNAIAIAPKRSAGGATRILINSHQPYTGPLAWYEAQLKSEEGWDMYGGVFPVSPFILHGFGPKRAWANTTNHPDLSDIFVLETDPNDPNRYKFDGAWKTLEQRTAQITLRLLGSFALTIEQPIFSSVYGPVIRRPHGTYAIRYSGHDRINQSEQYYRLNKSQTFTDFETALRLQALPNQNFVYADASGKIAYYYNAAFPKRDPAYDWKKYLPGNTSRTLWTEYLPFEAMPRVIDPASGFVLNANNTPFNSTGDPDNPKPEDFPAFMGVETRHTNRGLRARELLDADPSISLEDLKVIKHDKIYSAKSQMADLLKVLLAHDFKADPMMTKAQDVLRAYQSDMSAKAESRGAALAIMTGLPAVAATFFGGEAKDPIPLMRKAAETLMTHFGRLDPEWREVNRFRRGAIDVGTGGAPDVLRAVESTLEVSADGRFEANKGDTLVFFVNWDTNGVLTAEGVHQFGSATLDKTSKHYADQVEMFLAERYRPIWFDDAAVEANKAREYRPGK